MIMPWEAVVAALIAAVMHAGWNAGLKGGKDRLLDAALLFAVAGAIGLVSTFFAPAMNAEAALWIARHRAHCICLTSTTSPAPTSSASSATSTPSRAACRR